MISLKVDIARPRGAGGPRGGWYSLHSQTTIFIIEIILTTQAVDAGSTGAEAGVVLTEERAVEEVTITFVNVISINNHTHVCHRQHQCCQS